MTSPGALAFGVCAERVNANVANRMKTSELLSTTRVDFIIVPPTRLLDSDSRPRHFPTRLLSRSYRGVHELPTGFTFMKRGVAIGNFSRLQFMRLPAV